MWVTPPHSDPTLTRRALRATLRTRRRRVPPRTRSAAAERVALHVQREFHLHPGQRIALYAPLPEELDTGPLIRLARVHGCEIYLPRLVDTRRRRMRFVAAEGLMLPNELGILEPDVNRATGARWLDLVFLPLVGFDVTGMRLGMGAGYYDRAFAYRLLRRTWHGPRLIGLAYSFQQIEKILPAAHDVRLDAVVTDEGMLRFSAAH